LCACGTWSFSTRPLASTVPAGRPPSFATIATLSASCMLMISGLFKRVSAMVVIAP